MAELRLLDRLRRRRLGARRANLDEEVHAPEGNQRCADGQRHVARVHRPGF
jgi:hypothetical protein